MFDNLDELNYVIYAARHYDKPQCFDVEEFDEDMKRFKYLKRLFNKYRDTGELKERLILNHLIILINVFGPEAATRLLFLRLGEYDQYLAPFLVFLSALPDVVRGIDGNNIIVSDIPIDIHIVSKLRSI